MANLVISAAGAAVGFMVGGPTGAQIGWMLGSYLSADQAEAGQPTVGDLRVQTSQYGGNIPMIIGEQRVTGNIIHATDKTTYTIESGGGGGKGGGSTPTTVQTGYKVTMAIAICKGPIKGISRVWADGELIIDARVDANPLIGDLYLGTDTQNPDPTLQSVHGAADVPAYRGLAYIVLNNFDLGVSGRIPNFSFEVIKEGGL